MREPRVSEHALEVLEFRRVLERVAARAGSDLARDRIPMPPRSSESWRESVRRCASLRRIRPGACPPSRI